MSHNLNPSATRQQVISALSQIIGLPLTAAARAADMRMFQFGTLRQVDRGSVGDFAMHVQCSWRIEGPDGIVTGRSDLWEPAQDNAPFDEDWTYETSPNLQDTRVDQWFVDNTASLVVQSVDADDFGGVEIRFGAGFVIRLFPAGARGEDWRFFRPKARVRHLVVSGGGIQVRDDLDTT